MKVTIKWSLGIYVACVIVFLAIYPQLNLIVSKGGKWNGAFAMIQADESYYATFVNALINGRARKMDCLKATDRAEDIEQLPETDRSIQVLPLYLIALPARLF